MKLNESLSQFDENGISVYVVSPASPEEHAKLKKLHKLDFTFITDVQLVFPAQFGFYEPESKSILRGFIGIDPETDKMVKEVDFPFGDQAKEILELMKNL